MSNPIIWGTVFCSDIIDQNLIWFSTDWIITHIYLKLCIQYIKWECWNCRSNGSIHGSFQRTHHPKKTEHKSGNDVGNCPVLSYGCTVFEAQLNKLVCGPWCLHSNVISRWSALAQLLAVWAANTQSMIKNVEVLEMEVEDNYAVD